MKNKPLLLSALLLTATLLSCGDQPDSKKSAAQTDNPKTTTTSDAPADILAVVNGVAIPVTRLSVYAGGQPVTDENRDGLIKDIITTELVAQQAKKEQVHLDAQIRQELIVVEQNVLGRFLAAKVIDEAAATDEQINALYQEELKKLADKKEYKTAHILVESREQAEEILAKIKQHPSSFAGVAKEFSIDTTSAAAGGSLGWLTAEQLVPEFAAAMVSTAPSTLADKPVQTDYGWHILRVDEVRAVPAPALDEELKTQFERKIKADALFEFLENLRENATIEIVNEQS